MMEFTNDPEYQEYIRRLEEKRKTVKHGPDVIHLSYVHGLCPPEALHEIYKKN